MQNKTFVMPSMGHYTTILTATFKELGINIIPPVNISNTTNNDGIRNSSEMICWPYKVTLGSLMNAVKDKGVTDIIMYSSEGQCRYRHYGKLYELAFKNMNLDVRVHIIKRGRIIRDIRRITGASYIKIFGAMKRTIKKIKDYEDSQEEKYMHPLTNILLIGEIYTLLEPSSNFNIRKKLMDLGAGSQLAVTLSAFVDNNVHGVEEHSKEAAKYIDPEVGGHGFQNIVHTLDNIDRIDGVVYIMPLSCMPEQTTTTIIEHICKLHKTPLLKVEIDDNSSELNIKTRLEAFVDTIKRATRRAA